MIEVLSPETIVVPEETTYKDSVPVVVRPSMVEVMRVVPEMAAEASEERDSTTDEADSRPEERDSMMEEISPGAVVGTKVVATVVMPSMTVVYGIGTTITLV